jgi:hypothetical protein
MSPKEPLDCITYVPSTMIIGTAEIFNCFAYLMPLLTFCLTEKEFKYCSVTSGATPNFSKNSLIALGFCKKLPSLCALLQIQLNGLMDLALKPQLYKKEQHVIDEYLPK